MFNVDFELCEVAQTFQSHIPFPLKTPPARN